jgi:hypothetical protein
MGLVNNGTSRPNCPRKQSRYLLCRKLGWAPELEGTDADKLDPTGIRSPNLPDRSESLNRLLYHAQPCVMLCSTHCRSGRVVIAMTSPKALLSRIASTRPIRLSRIEVLFLTHSGTFTHESLQTALSLSLFLSMSIHVFCNFLIT